MCKQVYSLHRDISYVRYLSINKQRDKNFNIVNLDRGEIVICIHFVISAVLSRISRSIDVNARINQWQKSANHDRFYDSNRCGASVIYDRRSEREIEHTTRFKQIIRTISQPAVSPRRELRLRAARRSYPANFYFYLWRQIALNISHSTWGKKTQILVWPE